MYEAEIKLVVTHPEALSRFFDSWGPRREEQYDDTYFVHELLVPPGSERELRVRRISRDEGPNTYLLTFKDKIVESGTGSKREYETELKEVDGAIQLLAAMGFVIDIQFRKRCVNWRLRDEERLVLATLVTVRELSGHFLELETLVDREEDVGSAIEQLRELAAQAGLAQQDETVATYTDAVRAARSSSYTILPQKD